MVRLLRGMLGLCWRGPRTNSQFGEDVVVLVTTIEGVFGGPVSELSAGHGHRIVGWFPPPVISAPRQVRLDGG
ncbi:MAG: hypothetical protein ACRDY5_03450 [Acidimicrobiales bacterium]